MATPIAMKIANAPIPISELGNPKTSACAESITLLQLRVSEMLHDGTNCESFRSLILSIDSRKEATNPITPPMRVTKPEKLFLVRITAKPYLAQGV
jgi:hypothetical protein